MMEFWKNGILALKSYEGGMDFSFFKKPIIPPFQYSNFMF